MEAIQIADSITKLGSQCRGAVLVSGSHGGRYCGYMAALAGLRAVIFNDAGVGKDNAGIGALDYLQGLGIAAAAIAHTSARIGDGADMINRGRVSHCNEMAGALGCQKDQTCREAAEILLGGEIFEGDVPVYEESRCVLRETPFRILACDSASLITAADADAFIITGSHGGAIAGRPDYGIAAQARGAVFNDAGIGIDRAGIRRLEILDCAGSPAATVDAMTACIGDAVSAWESGILSHVNALAEKRGVTVGMTIPEFAEKLGL